MQNNFQSPGDVAFVLFNMPVYWYGIIMAVGIFTGFLSAYLLYKKFYDREKANHIFDFAPAVILTGIIGARLYYCLVNLPYYIGHPAEVFYIRQGGLSIHGMIIAGLAALYFYSKKYKMPFLKLFDVFLCSSALAQSVGRWGNFFNSEAFGYPTDLPWKLYIPVTNRPLMFINYEYFHPAFLYESILDFCVFIILLIYFKRFSKTPGITSGLYFILYSIVRIFVEHFRIDGSLYIKGVPIAQIVSIFMFLCGLTLLYLINKNRKISN